MSLWDKRGRSEPEESLDSEDILELLSGLVEKSLVVRDGATGRYRLLETVRQYGIERLVDGDESDGIRGRHLDYCLALAEEAEPHLTGADQKAWLERLEADHDNLRAALDWSLEAEDGAESGLRLGAATWRFWYMRGHFWEGRRRLSEVLERPCKQSDRSARAKALNGAGNLADAQADYTAARGLHERSLEIRRELDDRDGIASSMNNLGMVAMNEGDYAAARGLYGESLAIKRELGDRYGIATSMDNLGSVAYHEGDYPAARALYEESLAIRRELDDRHGIALSLNNLGSLAYEEADYSAARALYEESLAIKRELGDRWGIADTLDGMGRLAWASGDPWRAARLLGASESLLEAIGSPRSPKDQAECDRDRGAVVEALGEAAFDSAFNEGRAMTWEQAVEYALSEEP